MNAFRIFALIADGVIKNIGCYKYDDAAPQLASEIAHARFGEDALAIEVTHIPVQEGDTYENGDFYRDGVKIRPIPTEEEQIASLNSAVDDLAVAILEG